MTRPDGMQIPANSRPLDRRSVANRSDAPAGRAFPPITLIDDAVDPGIVARTCANCGATMDERKCKLICRCGYFLSCSDYY